MPGASSKSPAETVVIIDDDLALLDALTFGLELEGFAVQPHSGLASVRVTDLPSERACLVIDYRLPGLNGLELLRRLRADGVAAPAVIITSHPDRGLSAKAAKLGAEIVEKPLLGDALTTTIKRLIRPTILPPPTELDEPSA